MSDLKNNSELDVEGVSRRDLLASLAKYSAVAGASTVILSSSAVVVEAAVSGGGAGCTSQNPGNGKCVGNSKFDGVRGQVPSGRGA